MEMALSKGCGGSGGGVGERDLRWGMKREKREKHYPPPMPSLARTGNLPSHMPWVLKKCYTGDGRLVITEEKVKHHGYFRAHRSNGRLTLHLVPLDDGVLDSHDDNEVFQEEEEKMNDIVEAQYDKNTNQSDHDDNDENESGDEGENGGAVVLPEAMIRSPDDAGLSIMGGGGGGGGGNFYNYGSLRSSSCMLGMPVLSIRQVHI
ncbi:unnamed protein product [Ilex paraguariensis]|uniref:FAF domain-containing protein n=1 Tax=Ilex paraguariensis TaxID=185542 RepID=A0ABC8TZF8_9AQUA